MIWVRWWLKIVKSWIVSRIVTGSKTYLALKDWTTVDDLKIIQFTSGLVDWEAGYRQRLEFGYG